MTTLNLELPDEDLDGAENENGAGWAATWAACRECGHRVVATVPLCIDLDRMECSKCGRMGTAVTHWIGDGGEQVPRLELACLPRNPGSGPH